jgi:hypothetical protein
MAKPKVRRVEMSMKKVKDAKGKMQKRHVVTAHFHPQKAKAGKGMEGAFPSSSYQSPESTEHETAQSAADAAQAYTDRMEPSEDGSPY